jgi:hypothetical protein
MTRSLVTFGAAIVAALGLAVGTPVARQQPADQAMVAKARQIHDKVITLDTHVDIGVNNFTAERNYTQELSTQVDLPKMLKGGLDAVFLIVYVGQDRSEEAFTKAAYDNAYQQAIEKFEAIHRLTKDIAPDRIELALTAADVRRINAAGKMKRSGPSIRIKRGRECLKCRSGPWVTYKPIR